MKRRVWIRHRIEKLPEIATTGEVQKTLGVARVTLDKWLQDPFFQAADVARKRKNGRYVWYREKLKLWIVAIAKIGSRSKYAENPGEHDEQTFARAALGIPEDYTIS